MNPSVSLKKSRKLWHNAWPPLMVLVIIILIWEFAVRAFDVSLVVLPPPSLIFSETVRYFRSELLEDWLATIKILGIGYFTGVPTGLVLASLISQSKLAIKAFTPLITVLVTLPVMVIIPIYMVWVGYQIEYRAIPVFLNVASIITLNTLSGFINVETRMLELASGYGASRAQTFFKFILPNAMPEIFQGLRLGCTFSILNTIGIELIAGKIGMGFSVQYFSGLLKTPIVWGCILIVGITGRIMFSIVQSLEKRFVTWTR
ncbi:MAG TPA: ABC transporter permease [Clostridiaceae bacterium]|nr:ABC transporter permease [Clostridiaceae bacterium]